MAEVECFCGKVYDSSEVSEGQVCSVCGSFIPSALVQAAEMFEFYFAARRGLDEIQEVQDGQQADA